MGDEERVVLVDEAGNAVGTALKRSAHHQTTPLHLAFSCYIFDAENRLLITRRALHKPTWPGIWTNSVCGHPAPGEDLYRAVARRAKEELGMELRDLQLVLPAFRYQATMANGVKENELCPVLTAHTDVVGQVRFNEAEVAAVEWVAWTDFRDQALTGARPLSPWCVEQVAALAAHELADGVFQSGSPAELPSAARGASAAP